MFDLAFFATRITLWFAIALWGLISLRKFPVVITQRIRCIVLMCLAVPSMVLVAVEIVAILQGQPVFLSKAGLFVSIIAIALASFRGDWAGLYNTTVDKLRDKLDAYSANVWDLKPEKTQGYFRPWRPFNGKWYIVHVGRWDARMLVRVARNGYVRLLPYDVRASEDRSWSALFTELGETIRETKPKRVNVWSYVSLGSGVGLVVVELYYWFVA